MIHSEKRDYFNEEDFVDFVVKLPMWVKNVEDLFIYCMHLKYRLYEARQKTKVLADALSERKILLNNFEDDEILNIGIQSDRIYSAIRQQGIKFSDVLNNEELRISFKIYASEPLSEDD